MEMPQTFQEATIGLNSEFTIRELGTLEKEVKLFGPEFPPRTKKIVSVYPHRVGVTPPRKNPSKSTLQIVEWAAEGRELPFCSLLVFLAFGQIL